MAFKRSVTISPYVPDRTYAIGDNTGQATDKDNGKAVKMSTSDSTVVLTAAGDEIFGFISSVEPYTDDGHSIGSVICDSGQESFAADEAGGLAIGDLVVAGNAVAFGTQLTTYMPVKAVAGGEPGVNRWMVIETFGGTAGDKVLLRKL